MPLSKIQTDILRLLAAHRDPESYVAGATPLGDFCRDRAARVAPAALADGATLEAEGYVVL